MNDKLYDAFEICLQEIENGVALENVLTRFPDLAHELRPILKASIKARMLGMAASAPSAEVVRRGREKLLQRASQMRDAKVAPRKRVIPIFQRLALTFGLTATFLITGTSLVGASASALPGENLYPVKRTWEGVQLFFIFNKNTRDALKSQFETERLHEVNELLAEGRHELIQFAGVFTQVNGTEYVSGVTVVVPANLSMPGNGAAVVVTGRTNAQGFVELESIQVLPDGVFVPAGQPVQVDSESATNSNSDSNTNSESVSNSNEGSENGASSGSGNGSVGNSNETGIVSEPAVSRQSFEADGIIQSFSNDSFVINGKTVYLDNATIEGDLQNGSKVAIKGYYADDGRFIATEVKVEQSGTGGSDGNSGSSSNSNNDGSGSDNSHSGGNDSGSGGGGGGDSGGGGGGGNENDHGGGG